MRLVQLGFVKNEKGITLIELVISLALGLVLVGGISLVYIENKRNYVFDEEVARMQENGQFALGLLVKELSMQGFFAGSVSQFYSDVTVTGDCGLHWATDPSFPMDFVSDVGVKGGGVLTKSSAGSTLAACVNAKLLEPGSDVFTLKRLASMPTMVNGVYQGGLSYGQEKNHTWYVRLKNYQNPAFVYVDNAFDKKDKIPSNNISMWVYLVKIFFVRKYSVSANESPAIPTLMMASLKDNVLVSSGQPAVALVEGVECLHLEFGIPDEAGNVIFTADPEKTEISRASMVRIYLLMRTRNPVRGYVDKKTYKLGTLPAITPANKNYVRRIFSTTVKFRNHLNG